MSQAASQAWAFYRDVAKHGVVWTVADEGGYPAPKTASGQRAQPFWSTRARVERIIKNVPAYAGFRPVEISWPEFASRWVPGLEKDGFLVGVNWSGPRAAGFDLRPSRVRDAVVALMPENADPS
ncbi:MULTISPECIES: DUF2750 domain-containing protein [unclassified Caulobacter]|uniref:DUF2750 domain-containing protein n=1 Tax=unclassified Caulobacter TaxID=2648921 RepID=UPI0009E0B605|nr:DUF2750 domain-containing protein [Caulobacter sp. UNC358MFTsu5.1]